MADPVEDFVVIADGNFAAGQPVFGDDGLDMNNNSAHLKDVLYGDYTPIKGHNHDGVNSARVAFPANYISGGAPTIDSDTEINLTALNCADSDNSNAISIAAQTLDITVATDWIAGSVPASYTDLTVHVFAGLKTGESDPLFYLSESVSPTGFDYYKYVGSYLCDSSGDLLHCRSYGNGGRVTIIYDLAITVEPGKSSSWNQETVPVPDDLVVGLIGIAYAQETASSGHYAQLRTPGTTGPLVELEVGNGTADRVSFAGIISTNDSKEIDVKSSGYLLDHFELHIAGYEIRR